MGYDALIAFVCMNSLATNAGKRKTLSLPVMFGDVEICNELRLNVYRVPINKINNFMCK